jgi:hypothetical protein
MPEQDGMDRLLRQSMMATPAPKLSSGFDARLAKRLRPRRLNRAGRITMAIYTMLALIVSVGVMRAESIHWILAAISILVPLTVVAVVQLRQRAY